MIAARIHQNWEFVRQALAGPWDAWRKEAGIIAADIQWQSVELPHCYTARDSVAPEEVYYQGDAWYRSSIEISNPFRGGRTLLRFGGVGQSAEVFVDTIKAGEHVGGYDGFEVDLTEAADQYASNHDGSRRIPVAVRCNNGRSLDRIPSNLSDFTLHGGIYRSLDLVYVPAVSLAEVTHRVITVDNRGLIEISARLRNPDQIKTEVEILVTLISPGGEVVATSLQILETWSGKRLVDSVEIENPTLWSVESPALYTLDVALASAHGRTVVSKKVGFRTFEFVKHGPFKLNGSRLLLRGTHRHEDHAGLGAAMGDALIRREMTLIKQMGANFIRLGHYQQSQTVLDLCDELGLLVWEEIPWCRGGLGGDAYREMARRMLRAMIAQHSHHPSIILWGLGNENDWPGDTEQFDPQSIREFMIELHTLAKELDSDRLTAIRRCDFCKDIPDVYSPSIWAGWYRGRYEQYEDELARARYTVDALFHAEWGADCHAGRHSEDAYATIKAVELTQGAQEQGGDFLLEGGEVRVSRDGDWSETYCCDLIDWHLKEQVRLDWFAGSAHWPFKDFSTPLRPENPIPYVNQKGVVQRDLEPKEAYYVFQSYWTDEPMIRIYSHTWPVRWGEPSEQKTLKVYSNCSHVELFLNGRSMGVKQRNDQDFPAAGLRWITPFQEGVNTVRAVGSRDGIEVCDEITFEYQTARWGPPAKLAINEIVRDAGIVTVQACLLDAAGVPCLDARNMVRFTFAGDGRLLDDLGTSTGSRIIQLANGCAAIRVQLTGNKAVVAVSTEGIESAILDLSGADGIPRSTATPFDIAALDCDRILNAAERALSTKPMAITDFPAPLSEGGPNDFYSNGDYWWPDPSKPDGLPYIRRDGESNPDNFSLHRMALRDMRDAVSALAAAYKITGDDRYVARAIEFLRHFFLNPPTRMNPNLQYAQAIPGVCQGRGIGIIDALHFIEVPRAIEAIRNSPVFPRRLLDGLREWFRDLAVWMATSSHGLEEAATENNHTVAYHLQLAAYAGFYGDETMLSECRRRFKEVFVPEQMAPDGSFPRELARTKPYGYSIFQLDNMATLCHLLSSKEDDLWTFRLPDGRSIRKAMDFLYPYLADKSQWPRQPDVQAWESLPARQPCLLFAGLAFAEPKYLDLWHRLPADPSDMEVRRNIAVTQPLLWLNGPPPTINPT